MSLTGHVFGKQQSRLSMLCNGRRLARLNRMTVDTLRMPFYNPSPRGHMFRKINLTWGIPGKEQI